MGCVPNKLVKLKNVGGNVVRSVISHLEVAVERVSKKEIFLLVLLGAIAPVYPAIRLQEAIHGDISILKTVLISLINVFLIPYFALRGLKLIKDLKSIGHYLDIHYSEEEQRIIIKNFREFKSKLFCRLPIFTKNALDDPVIQKLNRDIVRMIFKFIMGGLIFAALLFFVFYLLIWF